MRNSLLFTLALAASYANAENLLDADTFVADQLTNLEGRMLKESCYDRVKSAADIGEHCFFRTKFYQSQSAAEKIQQIWDLVVPNEDPDAEPLPLMWNKFDNFFTQKSQGSFCQALDIALPDRAKIVHNQGLVAKVSWEPVEGTGYSGFLETGSDNIIMRISEAQNLTELSTGLTPAAAFKFFVDGIESQNILVQNSFTASNSWNFFENRLANRVKPFNEIDNPIEFQTLHRKLTESNRAPYGLAIGHIADKYEDGETIEKASVSMPWELHFKAPADKKANFDFADNSENWYDRLRTLLSEGDTIYEVYACSAPGDENCEEKIADVVLQTDLIASATADEKLYFRHRMQDPDRKYLKNSALKKALSEQGQRKRQRRAIPVPKNVWPEDIDEAEQFYIDQVRESGCPFAWLL